MPAKGRTSKSSRRRTENIPGRDNIQYKTQNTVCNTVHTQRTVYTQVQSVLPPASQQFTNARLVTRFETEPKMPSSSRNFDNAGSMTTLKTDSELPPETQEFDNTVVTTFETDPEPQPSSRNFDSVVADTTFETDPELHPVLQDFDNALVISSGNGSFRDGSMNPSQEIEAACCGTVGSEPSPESTSEDSGFASACVNGSYRYAEDSNYSETGRGESALRELGIELDRERHKNLPLPKRPGKGTFGRKVRLTTNCYPIEIPSGSVYHYDVEVIRLTSVGQESNVADSKKYRCLRTKEKRKIVERMVERDAVFEGLYPAYDGEKNLFTRRPLSGSFPHVFTMDYEDDTTQVQVRIKPVKKEGTMSCAISLDAIRYYFEGQSDSVPTESIVALEIILRHTPCLTRISIGRSFFSPPGPGCLNPLAGGLELWHGYHQSVRICQWKPTVNLDVSSTVFYPGGSLLDYVAAFLNITLDALRDMPLLPDRDRNRLSRKLKDRKVEAIHSRVKRKYTVLALARESAFTLRVQEDGPTVARYFKERYNIDLEFPNLPCLRVKPTERNVYLPIELCKFVPGQHYNQELSRAQVSEMVKFTCSAPRQRFKKIDDIRRGHFEDDRCAREFGIEVSAVPLSVEGRTLDSPSLIYGSDYKVRPKKDATWNMRNIQFFKGADIRSWALLAFSTTQRRRLETFGRLLKETGRNLGLRIREPDYTGYINWRDLRSILSRMKEEQKIDLVVIVVPECENEVIYGEVKRSAETVFGLITQCIRENTVLRIVDPESTCVAQLLTNLFLKINAKAEGVNYSLVLSEIPSVLWKPVIIMGADVNHPGSYRGLRESLAACSGSLDARCSLYAVRTMPQINADDRKGAAEIILDLQAMTMDLLRAFYRHTRKKPEKIIFYRDGVSEGEFQKVKRQEVAKIRSACKEIQADYEPGITFIVMQKRHHVRFMTERSNLNLEPGTVIDEGVTHPENFDFFLCSQKSGKGTARPAHYTVLEDDNDFTANDLQKLTNQLCYSNVRCTKSTSIPAPVAYAHLAAYRARRYLDASREGGSSGSSNDSESGRVPTTLEDSIENTRVVQEMKNRMYFV